MARETLVAQLARLITILWITSLVCVGAVFAAALLPDPVIGTALAMFFGDVLKMAVGGLVVLLTFIVPRIQKEGFT